MARIAQPTHVVFDVGGVLIAHVRSWREAHERTAVPWDDYYDTPEFFEATRDSVAQHMSGLITPEEWCDTVSRLCNQRMTPAEVRAVLEAWMYDDYPGVTDVIDAIHDAGHVTATLSNANHVHWEQVLAASDALNRVQHLHASHFLGAVKPDRAIFAAFEQATRFPRESILFFDDIEENVAGARAYGWRAEHIDHAGDTAAQLRAHLRRHGVFE
ncbi:MAG: HAD-IA family hydrolase [Dehalococcoidia bacterium]